MHTSSQRHVYFFGIALLTIPAGLLARHWRSGADTSTPLGFVATYLGDTLWAALFFFVFAGCFIRWRTGRLAVLTLGTTLGIESSQLYRGEPLATLRANEIGRALIGTQFLWSDVACILIGTAAAGCLHHWISCNAKP